LQKIARDSSGVARQKNVVLRKKEVRTIAPFREQAQIPGTLV
jgi:hypothetical protein